MARKHTRSISFYLSDEDYFAIKEAAAGRNTTIKDYLLSLHHREIGDGDLSINDKLDMILDELTKISSNSKFNSATSRQIGSTSRQIPSSIANPQKSGIGLEEFISTLRTERQRRNSRILYSMVRDAGSKGISLQEARSATSSVAKATLDKMVGAGLVYNIGSMYFLKES